VAYKRREGSNFGDNMNRVRGKAVGTKYTNCMKGLDAGREYFSNVLRKTKVVTESDT